MDAEAAYVATTNSSRSDGARGVAVGAVLAGALVALVFGPFALWLVRDVLHIGCGTYPRGTEGAGTWTCADGIGYLWVAGSLGAVWLLTVLISGLIAGAVRDARMARTALVLLGFVISASVLAWFWSSTIQFVNDEHATITAETVWAAAVGPAAAALGAGVAIAAASLFFRGRVAVTLSIVAAGLTVGAVALQPGLGLNLLPVAGLFSALAARSTEPAR